MLTDLFAIKLPSKEDVDIQCLCHNSGCLRTDLNSCFECPYHIPSIYALSTLCESIKADFKKFYEASSKPARYRMALSLHRKKMVLS